MPYINSDAYLYDVLTFIKDAGKPVGAGTIQRFLNTKGYTMAEATLGRLLRDTDYRGLTHKKSNQGRVLSDKGLRKLHELNKSKWQSNWTRDFMNTAREVSREHLIELLTARRPVEIEVARLAAKNATTEEIMELRSLIEEHERLVNDGESISHLDTAFHRMLAKMSHNQVLEAIVELLRKKAEDASEFELIRRKAGSINNPEHRMVYEAIEKHDAEMAILAMKRHLNNLLRIVENKEEH